MDIRTDDIRPDDIRPIDIRSIDDTPGHRAALAELLVQTVAGGASVGFMDPLAPERAEAFWRASLASAARGERRVYGAFADGMLVGTVSLVLDMPPNQPHRAEIAKLMTRPAQRGRGIGTALMRHAEAAAAAAGRRLIVLDTASGQPAASLYRGLGYTCAGEIPDYALLPQGGLCGTLVFWKRIAA